MAVLALLVLPSHLNALNHLSRNGLDGVNGQLPGSLNSALGVFYRVKPLLLNSQLDAALLQEQLPLSGLLNTEGSNLALAKGALQKLKLGGLDSLPERIRAGGELPSKATLLKGNDPQKAQSDGVLLLGQLNKKFLLLNRTALIRDGLSQMGNLQRFTFIKYGLASTAMALLSAPNSSLAETKLSKILNGTLGGTGYEARSNYNDEETFWPSAAFFRSLPVAGGYFRT